MKTIKLTLTLICLMLSAARLCAQQDAMISQYMSNQNFINPAYAGSHDYATLSGLVRKQWVDFPGSPRTSFISWDNRFTGSNMGLGFTLVNDKLGVTDETKLGANFAYHIPAGKGHLSFGIKAEVSYYNAKLSDLKVWEANDQVYASNIIGRWIPNAGAGVYYYTDKFYAGISTPHLINYIQPSATAAAEIRKTPAYERHYFLSTGYVFNVSDDVYIKPSTLVKYVEDAPLEADLNINVFFLKNFMLGGAYRTRDGLVAMTEIRVLPKLRLGYAFDYPLTKINYFSSGTHEVMLAYDFLRDAMKIRSPRFF